MAATRILVVDDDKEIAQLLRTIAEGEGFEARVASDIASFKAAEDLFKPDIIVTDILMPDADGVEVLKYLAQRGSTARIIILSGGDIEMRRMAKELGDAYRLNIVANLGKPLRVEAFRRQLAPFKVAE